MKKNSIKYGNELNNQIKKDIIDKKEQIKLEYKNKLKNLG